MQKNIKKIQVADPYVKNTNMPNFEVMMVRHIGGRFFFKLSKSVNKTDDNGKCFHQIRVLMVPNLQKWWNIEEKFLWPNRDLNPGKLKWKSDALWPTPSEPLKKWFLPRPSWSLHSNIGWYSLCASVALTGSLALARCSQLSGGDDLARGSTSQLY